MTTWFAILAAVLKIIGIVLDSSRSSKWYKEGMDAEAAREAAKIAAQSEFGRKALAQFNAMPESDVDDFLRGLEPGAPDHRG